MWWSQKMAKMLCNWKLMNNYCNLLVAKQGWDDDLILSMCLCLHSEDKLALMPKAKAIIIAYVYGQFVSLPKSWVILLMSPPIVLLSFSTASNDLQENVGHVIIFLYDWSQSCDCLSRKSAVKQGKDGWITKTDLISINGSLQVLLVGKR